MDARRTARYVAVLVAVTVLAFALGSVLIDAIVPAGPRHAMVLTAPGRTGSAVRDYAVPAFQAATVAFGVFVTLRCLRGCLRRRPRS